MTTVRIRLTGSSDDARAVMNALLAVEGLEHIEEIAELKPNGDDDSSSAGLPDDECAGMHDLEIEAPNATAERRIRELAEAVAFDLGATLEFVDEF